ncbi:MAG TPA: tetratricopeptide repeat protein [Terracidiphilus sp.]|nr:tetratricopeptide repeat protein [Terracidiphilus sp.]
MVRVRLILMCVLVGSAPLWMAGQIAPNPPGTQSVEQQPMAKPIADAEEAIAKSDWATAEKALDTWLAAHPEDGRALFDAGYVADQQNRENDAAGLYGRSVAAAPNSFETRLMYGLLLARQGKLSDARTQLVAATTLDPGEAGPMLKARAWRALAQIDKPRPDGTGDASQASTDLLEALKLSPETEADTLLAAQLAESQGQFDTAEAAYRRLLKSNPKSAAGEEGLAHLLLKQKKYDEAESLLRAALTQSPDDPALTAQLATALAAQNKAEALPLMEKLHAQRPKDDDITRMLADLRAQSGDVAGADALDVQLLATNPGDNDLLVDHGQNLIRQQNFREAFAVFEKATEANPANGDAWSGLAFAASKVGQPSVTLHALTMRSKYLPEVPSTYFLWAISYDTLRDKAQAITYYHHFLDAAGGKMPDQEWQARQRLKLLENK